MHGTARLRGCVARSMQLAAVLLAVVAIVIVGIATAYVALWSCSAAVMIGQSWWSGVLSLLALNIFAPRRFVTRGIKVKLASLVITHLGMLMLMGSFVVPDRQHLDGMLVVSEGDSNSRITHRPIICRFHSVIRLRPIPAATNSVRWLSVFGGIFVLFNGRYHSWRQSADNQLCEYLATVAGI